MNDYYVVKLLSDRGIYRPDTLVIGDVELRSPKSDYPEELAVLQISIARNKVEINPAYSCRIGAVVKAATLDDAERQANEKFIGALDIISSDVPISKIDLSDCGYIKDLRTGELKWTAKHELLPSMAFICSREKFKAIEDSQWIASQKCDMALRYRRSLHWSRNAKWEENVQLRILFRWFAVEALFKQTENDNVGTYIRWFLGYPNGPSAKNVSPDFVRRLEKNLLYGKWKRWIVDAVENIRELRNQSVHSGFRNVDYPAKTMLQYDQLMTFGCSRCQGAVHEGLIHGLRSLAEFREYISLVFEGNNNRINDVHGTILFSLETDIFKNLNNNIYG